MSRLTEKDLAKRWTMTARTLQSWRKSGEGPAFIQIGKRSIFYREEDVIAYEDSRLAGQAKTVEPAGWRNAMTRAAGALDVLAKQAKTTASQTTIIGLRDEIRALLA